MIAKSDDRLPGLLRLCALLLGLLGLSAPAPAAPDEDYQKGMKAYREGDLMGAMAPLKTAADAGHGAAQALLADILDKAEFDEEAVAYYRRSAEQGNADGQFGLGSMYSSGEGVKRDPGEARRWITRAAEQGHRQAINVVAQAYLTGDLGVAEDERKGAPALAWIRRAAEQSYVPALEALVGAYRTGDYGLAPDARQAEQLAATVRELKGLRKSGRKKK